MIEVMKVIRWILTAIFFVLTALLMFCLWVSPQANSSLTGNALGDFTVLLVASVLNILLLVLYVFTVKGLERWSRILSFLFVCVVAAFVGLNVMIPQNVQSSVSPLLSGVVLLSFAVLFLVIPVLFVIDVSIFFIRRVKKGSHVIQDGALKPRLGVGLKILIAIIVFVGVGVFIYFSSERPHTPMVINGFPQNPGQSCPVEDLGPAPSRDTISLTMSLKPQGPTISDQYIQSLSDPTSPNFHKWLTPADYLKPYAPSFPVAYDWLIKHGFSADSQLNQFILFSGTASQIENIFGIQGAINKFCMSWGYCYAGSGPYVGVTIPVPSELASVVLGVSSLQCEPPATPAKPVIYLYPTHKENVSVTLNYLGTLTSIYPSFSSSTTWNVDAYPDGHLIDAADGDTYSYLFWEGEDDHHYELSTGFVVKGSDTASFLQHQLAAMGLTPREYNEMIVYWLPKMEHNPYNLIHFAGADYATIAKLTIVPKPDSLLRVFMVWEPLPAFEEIQPQVFPTFHRNGFTVVEWGGMEI